MHIHGIGGPGPMILFFFLVIIVLIAIDRRT